MLILMRIVLQYMRLDGVGTTIWLMLVYINQYFLDFPSPF